MIQLVDEGKLSYVMVCVLFQVLSLMDPETDSFLSLGKLFFFFILTLFSNNSNFQNFPLYMLLSLFHFPHCVIHQDVVFLLQVLRAA